jgi:hypothetical protein
MSAKNMKPFAWARTAQQNQPKTSPGQPDLSFESAATNS